MQMNEIDFLIIGAAKSATTWLQQSLQQDPLIYMPDPELHYFSREFHRGDQWYLDQFTVAGGQRLIGEKSNSYLDMPAAVDRIKTALPNAKLIAQLRNPVECAYSDYCMLFRRSEVDGDIEQFLSPQKAKSNRFLDGGLYGQQIQAYRERFPVEQLCVMFFEDMKVNPQAELDQARSFLGLAPGQLQPLGKKVKDKETALIHGTLRSYLKPFKAIAAPFRKTKWFQLLRGTMASPVSYPPLTQALRDELTAFYEPDVKVLGTLLGRDLSDWLHGGAKDRSQPRMAMSR